MGLRERFQTGIRFLYNPVLSKPPLFRLGCVIDNVNLLIDDKAGGLLMINDSFLNWQKTPEEEIGIPMIQVGGRYKAKYPLVHVNGVMTLMNCKASKIHKSDMESYFTTNLGRKWKTNLKNSYGFLVALLGIYSLQDDCYEIHSISTNDEALQSFCTNTNRYALARAIKLMKRLGILANIQDSYVYSSNHNMCYNYIINRDQIRLVCDYIVANLDVKAMSVEDTAKEYIRRRVNILNGNAATEQPEIEDPKEHVTSNLIKMDNARRELLDTKEDTSRFNINSRTRLKSELSDDAIKLSVYDKHPFMLGDRNKALKINDQIQEEGSSIYSAISYDVKVKRSRNKVVTKISTRATSPLCNFPSIENMDLAACQVFSIKTREYTMLKEVGIDTSDLDKAYKEALSNPGKLPTAEYHESLIEANHTYIKSIYELFDENFVHYDIKSSVPRVSYLMHRGLWLDEEFDLYKMMFNHNDTDWSITKRDYYKSTFMMQYFNNTDYSAAKAVATNLHPDKKFEDIKDEVIADRKRMIETIGPSKGSEIFVHESNILLRARASIKSKIGKNDVFQVYDSMWVKRDVAEMYDIDIGLEIAKAAKDYYLDVASKLFL